MSAEDNIVHQVALPLNHRDHETSQDEKGSALEEDSGEGLEGGELILV